MFECNGELLREGEKESLTVRNNKGFQPICAMRDDRE